MLTGMVAKLVEFVLTTIVGKQLDLRLDDRKRVSRAFLALFDAILEVERVVKEFKDHLAPVIKGRRGFWMPKAWSLDYFSRAQKASDHFVDALTKVGSAISIYDLSLRLLLDDIYRSKTLLVRSPLQFEELNFEVEYNEATFKRLVYSVPSAALDSKAFERLRKTVENISEALLSQDLRAEPSAFTIEPPTLSEYLVEQEILPDDDLGVSSLYTFLEKHLQALASARESLAKFMRDNFKIEDLMIV